MSLIKERALQRHPLLERWGGEIRGRVRGWADLMFVESKVIIATMQELMAKGVPSMPVHDSLIVQASKEALAADTLSHQFRRPYRGGSKARCKQAGLLRQSTKLPIR